MLFSSTRDLVLWHVYILKYKKHFDAFQRWTMLYTIQKRTFFSGGGGGVIDRGGGVKTTLKKICCVNFISLNFTSVRTTLPLRSANLLYHAINENNLIRTPPPSPVHSRKYCLQMNEHWLFLSLFYKYARMFLISCLYYVNDFSMMP